MNTWTQATPITEGLPAPDEWWRKPPSGRWLYVAKIGDRFRWTAWRSKFRVGNDKPIAHGDCSTVEEAQSAADRADVEAA